MAFLKQLLATVAGIILSLTLFIIALAVVVIMVVSYSMPSTTEPLERGTILEINMNELIVDAPQQSPLGGLLSWASAPSTSILSALTAIECAEDDPNITALSLRMDGAQSLSLATASEIRDALIRFRESSAKPIYAYSEDYSQVEYYLSSVADSLYLNPLGSVTWQGVAINSLYFGDLLHEVGVKAEVFRPASCIYKSAVEPYTDNQMSKASREQSKRLADNLWSGILTEVATSRQIEESTLRQLASDQIILEAESAVQNGMVDKIAYIDQYEEALKRLGVLPRKSGEALRRVSLGSYAATVAMQIEEINATTNSKGDIAVIYADGTIVDGDRASSSGDEVVSGVVVKQLRRARFDDDVKAVVIRVNSPGGSALASEVICREVELLRAAKPVIVSMGAYAASGGYYISAPADIILANRFTLTGSIGVYGLMFAYEDALRKHLKINLDGVVSSPSADFGFSAREITPVERAAVMRGVESVYTSFKRHVEQGRDLSPATVTTLSGGRVWSGEEATECGLAEDIGGFRKAISLAAERCSLGSGDFQIVEYGGELDEWEAMINELFGGVKVDFASELFGELREVITMKDGVVALSAERVKF